MEQRKGYWMECKHHLYIALYYDDKFLQCFDNQNGDDYYMENIIRKIEKRTKMKFEDIPIAGKISDFDGLRYTSGFKKGNEIFKVENH